MQTGLPELADNPADPFALCVIWEPGDVSLEDISGIVAGTLSTSESERCSAFTSTRDQKRYLCSHFLRRILLSKLTGCPMAEIVFTRNRHGKPRLDSGTRQHSAQTWNFNSSSSGDRIAFVASNLGQCGIDIENCSDRQLPPDIEGITRTRVFSDRERTFFESGPGSLAQRFYLIWTLKEAYLKYTGQGLSGIEQVDMFDVLNLESSLTGGRLAICKGDVAAFHGVEDNHALSVVLNRKQVEPAVHTLNDSQVFSLMKGTFTRKRKSDNYA